MLTSHLLFVGFSLVDENFLDLSRAVNRVRREAEEVEHGNAAMAGTALALHSWASECSGRQDDLELLAMSDDTDHAEAARTLEVFLDRLAWAASRMRPEAAQYLLDQRYDEGFT